MKKKLTSVFWGVYILLGVLGFFVVTYVGSHLLENQLEKSISSDMYQTAHRIAESDLVSHIITSSDMDEIRNDLSLATGNDTIIWIINSNGQLILSTRPFPPGTGFLPAGTRRELWTGRRDKRTRPPAFWD